MNKIILFGGWGTLGKELQKLNPEIICPNKSEVDIRYDKEVRYFIKRHNPDLVINAAAILDNRVLETMPDAAISTNIIGSANVANACIESNARLVYISTDYVYKGDRGNYTESDEILPFNFYAWTKLGGECSAHGVKNHLIVRTSFGPSTFSYHQAFSDKWSSKDYVDVIAPLIYEAAISPITGILNLGTDRKTLYSYAIQRNEKVKPVKIAETSFNTPYDTSLNLQKWINYKSSNPIAKPHTNCRVCEYKGMTKYLDLGLMPLANNLEFTAQAAREKERFPLQVMFCDNCGLSQLSVVIDPAKMFSYYTYRSGINGGYVKHCFEMCEHLQEKYLKETCSPLHIDIAGNDGTLLIQAKKAYEKKGGYRTLNVDPASNLAAIAETQGIQTIVDFWSQNVAKRILRAHGTADLITATNVFAHVDSVREFIEAVKIVLHPKTGVLVLEFPYLVDFIDKVEYDTIYFEHLSYFSLQPLSYLCNEIGMKITNVEKQDIHGGTIRVTISNLLSCINVENSVLEFLKAEKDNGYCEPAKYTGWARSAKDSINKFSNEIISLKKQGFKISGFAASAKGNTLLNSAGINSDVIDYICDQTPEKIGKYSPGTGIPIVHIQELIKSPPDYLVILSWNFTDEIIDKAKNNGYDGKFIVPIPSFTIV